MQSAAGKACRARPNPLLVLCMQRSRAVLHLAVEGNYKFRAGYVNPYMDTTLISEGIESQPKEGEEGWKFYTAESAKVCSTPQGRFIAEQT